MRIYERIHHIKLGDIMVRVWASSENLRDPKEHAEQERQIRSMIVGIPSEPPVLVGTAEKIATLSFCNAVEVTRGELGGVLIYPDWP